MADPTNEGRGAPSRGPGQPLLALRPIHLLAPHGNAALMDHGPTGLQSSGPYVGTAAHGGPSPQGPVGAANGRPPPVPRLSSPVPRVHQAQTAARIPRPRPQRAALQARWGEEEGTERSGCRPLCGRRSGAQFLPTRPGVPRARASVAPQTQGLDTVPQHKPFSVSSPVLCAQRTGPPEARTPRPIPRKPKKDRAPKNGARSNIPSYRQLPPPPKLIGDDPAGPHGGAVLLQGAAADIHPPPGLAHLVAQGVPPDVL